MPIKDKLQIYIITYNRKNKLKETFDSILAENSPIRDFDITILDNASTDGTSELIDEYCAKFPNLKHIRHNINIGGNANICRAFEMSTSCGKDYAWILCDDDKYDFSNWNQVEDFINKDDDIICVSDYIFPSSKEKTNRAYQIFQMTFVPASIFKVKNITNGVLINMYDAILTMFQQSCLTIHIINNEGKISVLDRPIVHNGLHFEDRVDEISVSYTRGAEESEILARRKDSTWILGFCNVLSLLNDRNLQKECIEVSIPYKDIHQSWQRFYNFIWEKYFKYKKFHYFYELLISLPPKRRIQALKLGHFIATKTKLLLQWFFLLKNSKDKQYKIIRILGLNFSIKRT